MGCNRKTIKSDYEANILPAKIKERIEFIKEPSNSLDKEKKCFKYLKTGKLKDAESCIKKLKDSDNKYILLGQLLFLKGDYNAVKEIYEQFISKDKPSATRLIARIYEEEGKVEKAFYTYQKSGDIRNANRLRNQVLTLTIERFNWYLLEDRYDEAEKELEKMRSLDVDEVEYLKSSFNLAKSKGNFRKALEYLRDLHKISLSHDKYSRELALLEAEFGDISKALAIAKSLKDRKLEMLVFFYKKLRLLPIEKNDDDYITKEEFAYLLYWLFPEIRRMKGRYRIAIDISNSKYRNEIAVLLNLGVLSLDRSHKFNPKDLLTEKEMIVALKNVYTILGDQNEENFYSLLKEKTATLTEPVTFGKTIDIIKELFVALRD